MNVARLLQEQNLRLRPSDDELKRLKKRVSRIVAALRAALRTSAQPGRVFVGGSFAKGTLVKREQYDIDIFVRFPLINEGTVRVLEKCVRTVGAHEGLEVTRIHGSRDYFQLRTDDTTVVFEIIPVRAIRVPSQAENVTDLSYFHVAYVMKHARRLGDAIRLAKQFCYAQGIYGAESYIRGFSGYGLECLIIHYKTFLAFLRAMVNAEAPIILDPAQHYKNSFEAKLSLNEAKTHNPLILVDPTHKERNVLAALSEESFHTLQHAATAFLSRPNARAFEPSVFDPARFAQLARRKKTRPVMVTLTTDRQAGDIAGTKLKKSALYLIEQVKRTFIVKNYHFQYTGEQHAHLYLALRALDMVERRGPLVSMKAAASAFKRSHRTTLVKHQRLWARVPLTASFEQTLARIMQNREQLYQMGLVDATLHEL